MGSLLTALEFGALILSPRVGGQWIACALASYLLILAAAHNMLLWRLM